MILNYPDNGYGLFLIHDNEQEFDLDDNILAGIGTVKDEYYVKEENDYIAHITKRIGVVDMGTLDYIIPTWTSTQNVFQSNSLKSVLAGANWSTGTFKGINSKYLSVSGENATSGSYDKVIGEAADATVYIRDTAYTDAAALKAAMSGVMLYYELATPYDIVLDPVDPIDFEPPIISPLFETEIDTAYSTSWTNHGTEGSLSGTTNSRSVYDFNIHPLISSHKYAVRNAGAWSIITGQTTITLTESDKLFDLTRMFGSGNEPGTINEFRQLYPADYDYDPGSILNVAVAKLRTIGFNQWDEEWELGSYDSSTGAKSTASNTIRSKNYIPVCLATDYYFHTPVGSFDVICWYTAEKTFISATSGTGIKQSPAGAVYMTFAMNSTYGTSYKHDICVNLSHSGARNGEYEPYWVRTIDIPVSDYYPDGMNGIGTAYDTLGDVSYKRIGVVDLGTLTWGETAIMGKMLTYINNRYPIANYWWMNNCVMPRYTQIAPNVMEGGAPQDKTYSYGGSSTAFFIYDSSYTDAAAFKQAMSGVMLYYELAEPIEIDTDELHFDYRVSDYGTEEFFDPDATSELYTAPVRHNTLYLDNLRDTIRTLPTNYLSVPSLDQLIQLLEQLHPNTTITKVWDPENNRYNFSIA